MGWVSNIPEATHTPTGIFFVVLRFLFILTPEFFRKKRVTGTGREQHA
jgi:hypothetical protein